MPLCGVSYESNLVHGERERGREVQRERGSEKDSGKGERNGETERERGEGGGRYIPFGPE